MLFTKVHGLGNDFIIIDGFKEKLPEKLESLARYVCARNTGVGGDGLVVLQPAANADVRMRIFNPDGSEPEMCGNAIRCVAQYMYKRGLVEGNTVRVDTLAGLILPTIIRHDTGEMVRVDMGEPRLNREEIPMAGGQGRVIDEKLVVNGDTYRVTAVSMGNPHCIIFVSDVKNTDLTGVGPSIENHKSFPNKTNVEFVQVINRGHVLMRVWERGVGETMACGTGACAVCVACVLNDLTDRAVKVSLNGGDLYIEWEDDNHVYMTGPAEEVFEGKLILV
ncbi:MAG TPA: diaminopimelate epimerase [Clostridia bacterium]|nr:diaminopimelate epimerase [Clostridia bacterium]